MWTRALGVTFAVAVGLAVPATAGAATNYVALGDSYTSAPFVSPASSTAPSECGQSAINYPHLTAAALGLTLRDMSCGGATTANMTKSQYSNQPAQFSALSGSTAVVTISIGGNDHGLFAQAIGECGLLDIADALNIGAPCKSVFGSYFAKLVSSDGPTVGAALEQIHRLAPQAQVFVVGYPDILPQSGGCYPQMPLTDGDVAYMNGVEKDVDTMLATEAAAHGATYVDTYTPSIGHDVCQPERNRWIEPPIPGTHAAPIHPNAAGEAGDATAVEAAMRSAGVS